MIEIKDLLKTFNDVRNGLKTITGKIVLDGTSEFFNLTPNEIAVQNPDELQTSKVGCSHDITKALHLMLQKEEFSERLKHHKMSHKCILLSKFENPSISPNTVYHTSFIILNYNKKIYLLDPFTYKDEVLEFKTFKEALEKKIFDWKLKGTVVTWRLVNPSDFKFKKLNDYLHIYE